MKKLLMKYKPQLFYTLFGTISTVIDISIYQLCFIVLEIPNTVSNVIAWFVYVAFSFITNKIWVYESRSMKLRTLLKEGAAYYAGRFVSLVFGTVILIVGVDLLDWNSLFTKLVSDIAVMIINYGFGFLVFKQIEKTINEG